MPAVILFEPEIPPNTGNIIRLCANTGFELHLIEPLGFALDDKKLRRAGLDYAEFAALKTWPDLRSCLNQNAFSNVYACSTKGHNSYTEIEFQANDALLFGPETRGLPAGVLNDIGHTRVIRIPMKAQSRSLNLSNSVAVIVYEAWRQLGFNGGE